MTTKTKGLFNYYIEQAYGSRHILLEVAADWVYNQFRPVLKVWVEMGKNTKQDVEESYDRISGLKLFSIQRMMGYFAGGC
jgi:hypothetical protein